MSHDILLNGAAYHFKEKNLPCLITYQDKSGGSQMSITMVVDLFLLGSKVLLFTAYPMAKENFLEQIGEIDDRIIYIEKEEDLCKAQNYQAVIIKSGDEGLYSKSLNMLSDINDRVVLIKNIEVFGKDTINNSLSLQKVILSGDVYKCIYKKEMAKKEYKSIILFSKPEINLPVQIPIELEKYSAYLWSATGENGAIKVKI